jgi:hypothetical protein
MMEIEIQSKKLQASLHHKFAQVEHQKDEDINSVSD